MMNAALRSRLYQTPDDNDSKWVKSTRNGETQWIQDEWVIIERPLNKVGEQYCLFSRDNKGYRKSIGKFMTFKDAEMSLGNR